MLVAMERRESILGFANRKFATPKGVTDDYKLMEVFKAMIAIEKTSMNFFGHLEPTKVEQKFSD